jgi:outer membrane protein insertion porin family
VYHSNRGAITAQKPDPSDPTKLIEITDPNELRQFSFQAPEGACAGLKAPDIPGKNCNTVRFNQILTPIGGDTQLIYNIEYRVPIVSVLSVAAFADVGTVFNARKYDDQFLSSNFINSAIFPVNTDSVLTLDGGVIMTPGGLIATQQQVQDATNANGGTLPSDYKTAYFQGQTQTFQVVQASQSKWRIPEDIRSSLGLEFRVQMPVINVPFRLIMAYNPRIEDRDNLFRERRTVIRFSVGRTF